MAVFEKENPPNDDAVVVVAVPSAPKVGADVVCCPNEKLVFKFEDNPLLVVGATLLCGLNPKSPPVDVWVEEVPKVDIAAAEDDGVLPNEKALFPAAGAAVTVLVVVDGIPNIIPPRLAGLELPKEEAGVVVVPKENPPVEAVVVLLPKR